jgi:hypothetical protein
VTIRAQILKDIVFNKAAEAIPVANDGRKLGDQRLFSAVETALA